MNFYAAFENARNRLAVWNFSAVRVAKDLPALGAMFFAAVLLLSTALLVLLSGPQTAQIKSKNITSNREAMTAIEDANFKFKLWQERIKASQSRTKGYFYAVPPVLLGSDYDAGEACGEPITEVPKSAYIKECSSEDLPPEVLVRGILKAGDRSVAVIDIAGWEVGVVAEVGYIFAGGKAQVTEVDSKGVSWIWHGKKFRANF